MPNVYDFLLYKKPGHTFQGNGTDKPKNDKKTP